LRARRAARDRGWTTNLPSPMRSARDLLDLSVKKNRAESATSSFRTNQGRLFFRYFLTSLLPSGVLPT
jgi:hypothetical protein